MKEIPKVYNPDDYKDWIYQKWEESGFFNPDNLDLPRSAKNFSISMPPPNATGVLHIGHAMMLAIEDLVIRYKRMRGYRTLWLPGTDHAAIATQTVVEKKLLREQGKTRHNLGREKFLAEVHKFVEQSKNTIRTQIKKMGSSCDWSRERYTLDLGLSRAVTEVFIQMYNDGLIYRGYRIVNWCPRCASTLADDEVEYKETKAKLYTFRYSKDFPFAIATTRPETKLGDTAVAVNPKDERYKEYVGKLYRVDLGHGLQEIKIVVWPSVDPEFGTGALGVTPAHSVIDAEIAEKNNLPSIKVIGEDGRMTAEAGRDYEGLTVLEAREKFVSWLRKNSLLEKEPEEIAQNLSICYRCETPIEPLPSKQWFIDVDKKITIKGNRYFKNKSLKDVALEVVRKGEIEIIPERFQKIYFNWMENLRDWCISRQIWFGHQIPVWYCGGLKQVAQLKMGFHKSVVSQVFAGKTKTYRLRDHYFKVGDEVAFENSQTKILFGYGIIKNIEKTIIRKIRLDDPAHGATYKNVKQLIRAFKRHYPQRKINLDTEVWIYTYEFRPISKEERKKGCGQTIVTLEKPKECPACGSRNLIQDPDTLDTWFSSGLWTFSTLLDKDFRKYKNFNEWIKNSSDLKRFHPTSLMETGYDILFFWVARMILMTTYVLGEVPFYKVYLHGLVRDEEGRKMSKSLGNVIDPLDVIAKYGTDAVRLSLVIGATPGNDIKLYDEKIAGFRNFANKLWNIARYIINEKLKIKNLKLQFKIKNYKNLTLAEKWILVRLNEVIKDVTKHLENYEFSLAGEKLRDFTWGEFADWYLEIHKIQPNPQFLIFNFKFLISLWHPFMPFVTEVIWGMSFGGKKKDDLLMVQEWPKAKLKIKSLSRAKPTDEKLKIIKDFELIQKIIVAIRNLRAENKIEAKQKIKAVIFAGSKTKLVSEQTEVIKFLSGLRELVVEEKGKKPPQSIGAVVEGIEIYLPLAEIVDLVKERERVKREIGLIKRYIEQIEKKMANKEFLTKAPKEIVESEEDKLKDQKEKLQKLEEQLKSLGM